MPPPESLPEGTVEWTDFRAGNEEVNENQSYCRICRTVGHQET